MNPDEALSRFKSRIHKKEKKISFKTSVRCYSTGCGRVIHSSLSFYPLICSYSRVKERAYASRTHESWGGFGIRFT